ncbi:MAG: hypothetical protein ACLR1T_16380 [Evtepia gabavorous]
MTTGRAELCNKGKRRTVFLPGRLRRLLRKYLQKQKDRRSGIHHPDGQAVGPVKYLAGYESPLRESADVEPSKVFPTICVIYSQGPTTL